MNKNDINLKGNLEQKIANLENEIKELNKKKELLEVEFSIVEENLELSWIGNLGRWTWDYKSGKVDCNRKKYDVLGYDRDEKEFAVYDWTALIHTDDFDYTMDAMKKHLTGELPAYDVEYRIKAKDGSYHWFYDLGKVVQRDEDGKPELITGIVFDITQRKEVELKLRESEKNLMELNFTKDKVFSIVSHDLRNIFNHLINATNILKIKVERNIKIDDLKTDVDRLYTSSMRAFKTTENLFIWSKAQKGNINNHPEYENLGLLVNSVVKELIDSADYKEIQLYFDIPGDINIYADKNLFSITLRNLINNAIKFTPRKGNIKLKAENKDGFINLSVIDTGVGISDEDIDKLFDVKHNIKSEGTEKESGSGLGLIVSKQFSKYMGGDIIVESKPGKGSTFTLIVPSKSTKT